MSNIAIVGGLGYIGSRVAGLFSQLEEEGERAFNVTVIDANLFGNAEAFRRRFPTIRVEEQDVRDGIVGDYDTIIYLAGPHELPEGADEELVKNYYSQVMVQEAERLSAFCDRFVYASSMRSVTHNSLYARNKREAEEAIPKFCDDWRIVRFGTVYGGFSVDAANPNRSNTVPNRRLMYGDLPDENYAAYTTKIEVASHALITLALDDCMARSIVNVTDGKLMGREDLEGWIEWPSGSELDQYRANCPDPNLNLGPASSVSGSSSPQQPSEGAAWGSST